ncbi:MULTISPECIES: nuclear transport factor 2 family protein [unclassified Wenzhouxiangella]|uniref:nuclear transport factor 2 family protein n=1 Tax=unclassified Wenzhouxiangella TaxID=2613841 RepID=UPI000E32BD91|nr:MULTISPECIES: nuclear transport factor 2 family protein [unclassified Wenzhouxiangella]RFF26822.1 nuclear transport factor 2 family protein [Wenzhouxiangella sp. 15181]RFP68525.1 nuclear transport factor 2 family protein [Wenzhouxiangella sp. 15190]
MSLLRSAGLCGVCLLLLAACNEPLPDEERIRNRIETMQADLAEGNARSFFSPVAEDFSAATRNLDRRAARLLLRREMLAHESLKARLFDIEIELQGEGRATATMHAVLTGGSGLIPDTGSWYRVTTGWRLDDGDWMLISARWETVAGRG